MNAESLREICLQFAFVTEEIKWGADLVFSVGGKMFCVTTFDDPIKASFKVPDEVFEESCNREGFIDASYLARAKWVQADNSSWLSKVEWKGFVQKRHALVTAKFTKKLKTELGMV